MATPSMPSSRSEYDAVIVGAGPNGLSAAITLARAGHSVVVIEAQNTIGGGARSAELTLPGFVHDVCSTAHPLGVASPFFRSLPLDHHGLHWVHPAAPLAHPFDDGTAVVAERSVAETAKQLGEDSEKYSRWMERFAGHWLDLEPVLLGPLRMAAHPIIGARFALEALRPASRLARSTFRAAKARALFAGIAAHSILPLERSPSAAFGLILGIALHAVGWPFARGGSQAVTNALASYLRSLGGEIVVNQPARSCQALPKSRAALFDLTPRQLLRIEGLSFPSGYRRKLERYQYGPGVCKVDWALDAPIPWKAEGCKRAGTVHVGGTIEEIEAAERAAWQGEHAARPFVLLTQPTLFDPTRAPAGKHIAWAYCHVPNGSSADMSDRIEQQIERFAPGFRELILKRSVRVAASLEHSNANLIGGDITGGAAILSQMFTRPTWKRYRTPLKNVYICSSSTPPGAGVHGLCGYLAGQSALGSLR